MLTYSGLLMLLHALFTSLFLVKVNPSDEEEVPEGFKWTLIFIFIMFVPLYFKGMGLL